MREWEREKKSKQVIITHPNLFHCESRLGLIKTMKIGLIITCTKTPPDKARGKCAENGQRMRHEMAEKGKSRLKRNENKLEAFLMLLFRRRFRPEPTHNGFGESSGKVFYCYFLSSFSSPVIDSYDAGAEHNTIPIIIANFFPLLSSSLYVLCTPNRNTSVNMWAVGRVWRFISYMFTFECDA